MQRPFRSAPGVVDQTFAGDDVVRQEPVAAGSTDNDIRLRKFEHHQIHVPLVPAIPTTDTVEAVTGARPIRRVVPRLALQPPPLRDHLN